MNNFYLEKYKFDILRSNIHESYNNIYNSRVIITTNDVTIKFDNELKDKLNSVILVINSYLSSVCHKKYNKHNLFMLNANMKNVTIEDDKCYFHLTFVVKFINFYLNYAFVDYASPMEYCDLIVKNIMIKLNDMK